MDPDRKEKWIEATGRQNWFPAKTSTICSDHFVEQDFLIKSGKKYLADTAVPKQKILHFLVSRYLFYFRITKKKVLKCMQFGHFYAFETLLLYRDSSEILLPK